MTLTERLAAARQCQTPNCTRTTDWPEDPTTKAAYCRECTQVVLSTGRPPVGPTPAWVQRLHEGKLGAKELAI